MFKKLIAICAFLVALSGMAWGATYSDFVQSDTTIGKSGLEPIHNYVAFYHYRVFDFGDSAFNSGTGVSNADVVRLFNVEPNTIIEEMGYRVTTAAVISGTSAEIGDGKDIDGFVGHDYAAYGMPFFDLSTANSGITWWGVRRFPISANGWTAGGTDGGISSFMVSGVSIGVDLGPSGSSTFEAVHVSSNEGPYFSSGASPYIDSDTLDMTLYTNKDYVLTSGYTGVTPVFEFYIKGFKRVP